MQFLGEQNKIKSNGIVHQEKYIYKLKVLHLESKHAVFRSLRARFSSARNTSPGIFCAVEILAQVIEKAFDKNSSLSIVTANKVVQVLKNKIYVVFQYPKV